MPDTTTLNYSFLKPEINGSPNTWGNKLNEDLDDIDEQLKRVDDLATDAVLRAGSGVDDTKYIRAVLRYKSTVAPSDPLDLVQVALLRASITSASPKGSILIWGGTIDSIPLGYALCDGTTVNGVLTPNLKNRFVVGAGDEYAAGAFGGAKTHDHGGNTGSTVLTVSQIPSHNHGVNDPSHTHVVSDPGHAHSSLLPSNRYNYGGGPDNINGGDLYYTSTTAAATGVYLQYAYTGVSIQYNGGGTGHLHTIAAADHRPPYYALAYIMRVKYPWEA